MNLYRRGYLSSPYDPWWNVAQLKNQVGQDRAHRDGPENNVVTVTNDCKRNHRGKNHQA